MSRRDTGPAQMLGHRLAADTPALRHDAHVVAGLVLPDNLFSLGGGQPALLLSAYGWASDLWPGYHLRQRGGQAPELVFLFRACSC